MAADKQNEQHINNVLNIKEKITINVDSSDGAKENHNLKMDENGVNNDKNKLDMPKDLLGAPRREHRRSFMEEESARERRRLVLLKQCSAILKQGEQKYTKESLHKTFQDEDLLDRIFRLFDVDGRDHLVQEDWIEQLKERLPEERQLELVEQVESVAYALCGDGPVCPSAFTRILRNKVVTKKLFRVVDTDDDGYVTAEDVMEFIASISSSRPRVGIDKPSVDRLEQLFRDTAGDQKEITRDQFKKIVVSKNPFFTERVFQIFDEDDSGSISHHEFIAAVHRFGHQTPDDKIKFLFRVYDLDGDGLIQHRELQHVMRACMEENGMSFSDEQLLQLTAAMFEDADTERRGAITYEALRDQLSKHGGLLENLSISIDRWLVPPPPDPQSTSWLRRLYSMKPHQLSWPYIKNNQVFLGYLALFFLINLALFAARCVEYRNANGFVMFARACGQCLNFNCSWVLVLMLRRCITALRGRGLGSALPLDHHVYLHKLTGVLIVLYSILHTIMHLCNFSLIVVNDPVLNANNYTVWEWVGTTRPGMFGLVGGVANPTGLALVVVLAILSTCSRPAVRRGGSFEIFYWTHLLYIPFWILVIFHAPNFWKWFILPGTIYIIERIMRLTWMRSEIGKTYISSGILLPSRVTHLVIRRPPLFDFHAGDYVFVNVPAIARYEWHPFTISSAPEQADHIWLHVRGVGQWTNRLHEYFEREHRRLHAPDMPEVPDTLPHDAHRKVSRTVSGQSARSTRSVRRGSAGGRSGRGKLSVDFSPNSYTNDAFCIDEEPEETQKDAVPVALASRAAALLSPLRLLEKSRSMPDMQSVTRHGGRDYTRSESELGLSCGEARRARLVSLARSPQHRALAHSFRYMRTKPPIVALHTPSVDANERRRSNESILTIARRRLSKSLSPDKDTEAQNDTKMNTVPDPDTANDVTSDDYPVGKPLEIYLEGPYGAASSHIFRAEHAVLIAAGIGVTPFASILQSIMLRHRAARALCPRCGHTWHNDVPHSNMTLKKVDFFWINREQRSFEWFVWLLSQLEMEQAERAGEREEGERLLDMHLYITSALQRHDMRAVGLQLALDLLHEKEKRDLITGLKSRTSAGRPNWDKVFQRLNERRAGKVTVFYCGPPRLARTLRLKCDQFGFHFRKEVF
ncbi:NADPH oxidase 5 [Papilio xuthus]|uniref:NADPH oxidase 5 n=1 Tax=Papilio xuthus TaxID=66420 RepID=A0A194QEC6_PAPXU|nr:NADPH oxidase 5 [Papilio xuthus]